MQSGIWDALEELRVAKSDLEGKLKEAQSREQLLKTQLQDLRAESVRRLSEAKVDDNDQMQIRSENDVLRKNLRVLEERLEAMSWSELALVEKSAGKEVDLYAIQETHRCETESLKKEHAELQESLRSENVLLKRERRSLQERLEIFERALELETPVHAKEWQENLESLDTDCEGNPLKPRLGEKLEQLHSQFVMEVVGLRKEVAGLKKKKWVLRSVLANGGETERKAIENEVAELRRTTGALDMKARSDKIEQMPLEIDTNMVTTEQSEPRPYLQM